VSKAFRRITEGAGAPTSGVSAMAEPILYALSA
jgi:hypothetical protein